MDNIVVFKLGNRLCFAFPAGIKIVTIAERKLPPALIDRPVIFSGFGKGKDQAAVNELVIAIEKLIIDAGQIFAVPAQTDIIFKFPRKFGRDRVFP
jgi:hypothetical protein